MQTLPAKLFPAPLQLHARPTRQVHRPITGLAFLNTDVAASFAAVTWLVIEWQRARKPKFVGLLTGAVAGLATITPAAGYVSLP